MEFVYWLLPISIWGETTTFMILLIAAFMIGMACSIQQPSDLHGLIC